VIIRAWRAPAGGLLKTSGARRVNGMRGAFFPRSVRVTSGGVRRGSDGQSGAPTPIGSGKGKREAGGQARIGKIYITGGIARVPVKARGPKPTLRPGRRRIDPIRKCAVDPHREGLGAARDGPPTSESMQRGRPSPSSSTFAFQVDPLDPPCTPPARQTPFPFSSPGSSGRPLG
jgi:hypothetical protein